jgi:hypothetical protein
MCSFSTILSLSLSLALSLHPLQTTVDVADAQKLRFDQGGFIFFVDDVDEQVRRRRRSAEDDARARRAISDNPPERVLANGSALTPERAPPSSPLPGPASSRALTLSPAVPPLLLSRLAHFPQQAQRPQHHLH